jgi:hypothetical protein
MAMTGKGSEAAGGPGPREWQLLVTVSSKADGPVSAPSQPEHNPFFSTRPMNAGGAESEMEYSLYDPGVKGRRPWNVGRTVGAKRALKLQQVWAIRFG